MSFVVCFCLSPAHAKKVPLREIPPAANGAFNDLLNATEPQDNTPGIWKLLVTDRKDIDAHTDQKGTIWVEGGLADVLGNDRGLWAAVLSHEIAHNLHKRNQLVSLFPVLGARVQRRDESVADVGGMLLMAKAGYHPLYMLKTQQILRLMLGEHSRLATFFGDHPRWDTRVGELQKNLQDSEAEFDKRWPQAAQSPGGDPPLIVLIEQPRLEDGNKTLRVEVQCLGTGSDFQVSALGQTVPGRCGHKTYMMFPSPAKKDFTVEVTDGSGRVLDRRKTCLECLYEE